MILRVPKRCEVANEITRDVFLLRLSFLVSSVSDEHAPIAGLFVKTIERVLIFIAH